MTQPHAQLKQMGATTIRSSTMENLKTMLQGKKGLIVGIANDNSIA